MRARAEYTTDNEAVVYIDDLPAYTMRRRAVSKNLRGFWDLLYASSIGEIIVDTDQYRNDLLERCHRALQTCRFSVVCTEEVYLAMHAQWEVSLSAEFNRPIEATYADYEGVAQFHQRN